MYITDMIRKENGIIQYAQLKPKRQKKKEWKTKKQKQNKDNMQKPAMWYLPNYSQLSNHTEHQWQMHQ